MRISRCSCANGTRRGVETAGGKFEHSLNLLPRYMKLLHDFFYARTRLKIFKNRSDRHPRIAKHPCAAAPVGHAFNGGALRPVESCHVLTPVYLNLLPRFDDSVMLRIDTYACSHPTSSAVPSFFHVLTDPAFRLVSIAAEEDEIMIAPMCY